MKFFLIISSFLYSAVAFATDAVSSTKNVSSSNAGLGDIGWFVFCSFGVIALIFLLSWLLKRLKLVPGVAVSNFKILSVLAVGQKEKIILVKAGDEQLLVGVTAQNISLIHKLEKPLELQESSGDGFKKVLTGLTKKNKE